METTTGSTFDGHSLIDNITSQVQDNAVYIYTALGTLLIVGIVWRLVQKHGKKAASDA